MKTFHGLGPDQPTSFGPKTRTIFIYLWIVSSKIQRHADLLISPSPMCMLNPFYHALLLDTINVHNYKLIMTLSQHGISLNILTPHIPHKNYGIFSLKLPIFFINLIIKIFF